MLEIKGLLSAKEVAELLGVSIYTVRAWTRQGRIPRIKAGRRVLFKPCDIEVFIESNKIPARVE